MTSPALAAPRARRLGLYGPFIALAMAVIAWSAVWLWLSGEVARRLDETRALAARTGHHLDWRARSIHGYPFRLDVDFADIVFHDPSGWGVAAPSLKTEAFAYAPGHWVAVAPMGLTLTRPAGGDVKVGLGKAGALRASLSERSAHPARFSLEGIDLSFTPAPGAAPFLIQAAKTVNFHIKSGPDDQGAFYLALDQAEPRPGSLLSRIAAGGRLNLVADGLYSHASALTGAAWAPAVNAWSAAGGEVTVRQFRLQPGAAILEAGKGGVIGVGPDGRWRGELPATLTDAPRTLSVMALAGATTPEAARLATMVVAASSPGPRVAGTLNFMAGRALLGPVALGPAPKVY
jgi:hypothetical protein